MGWVKFPKPVRNRKYNNTKLDLDGFTFDSKAEGSLYVLLKAGIQSGEYEELTVKPNVYLTDARILVIPDFSVVLSTTKQTLYVEFKGLETAVWRIKRRLWKHYGPGVLRVFKGNAKSVRFHEDIVPLQSCHK